MIAATPLRANPRRICRYTTLSSPNLVNHLVSADTNSPRICTFHGTLSRALSAHTRTTPPTHFVSALTKTGGHPRLESQARGFSAPTHFAPRPNPSAPASFALLRVFAPLREPPEVAFDPNPPKSKIYPIEMQGLRNSISRNSHIPKELEIPRGGGG